MYGKAKSQMSFNKLIMTDRQTDRGTEKVTYRGFCSAQKCSCQKIAGPKNVDIDLSPGPIFLDSYRNEMLIPTVELKIIDVF